VVQEDSPSLAGVTLDGRYRILEPVGDGGAGSVFRARQLNVDRDVAVKVLDPLALSARSLPDAIARFEAEARIVSKLRHPHTIKLLDFGRLPDGRLFLVMEFLHGQSLDKVLAQGPLSERRTLRIVREVAEALAEAHQQGIIHRDLKPGNLFLDQVGEQEEVKVIDFGIAKVAAKPFQTEHGLVFGTPAYMSPEQAQGLELDARSDLYSLGVVAYHCLTGRLPFESDTPVGLLLKTVSEPPPPLASLTPKIEVAPGLERLLLRLLAKRPRDRPASAIEVRDAVLALEHPSGPTAIPEALSASSAAGKKTQWRLIQLAGLLALVALLAFLVVRGSGATSSEQSEPGQPIASPAPVTATLKQLTDTPSFEHQPAISSDGAFIAYVSDESGKSDIFLRRVAGERAINLTGDTKGDNFSPSFSPDGTQIAFTSTRDGEPGLYLMGVTGENVRRVADKAFNPTWMPDGKAVVYATSFSEGTEHSGRSELFLLDLTRGEKHRVTEGDAVQPNTSPRGFRIAFGATQGGNRDIWTIDPEGRHPVAVTQETASDTNPVWAPDGGSLYFLSNRTGVVNLWRVPIDEESGALRGPPRAVTTGTVTMQELAVSRNGLGISALVPKSKFFLTKQAFDPEAEVLVGPSVSFMESARGFCHLSLSSDEEFLAFVSDADTSDEDLAVVRIDGTGRRLITSDGFKDRRPVFSPDGSKIAFYSDRGGRYQLWTIRPDGTGMSQVTDLGHDLLTPAWSGDGLALFALSQEEKSLMRIGLTGGLPVREAQRVVFENSPALPLYPVDVSPDGKKLAANLCLESSSDCYLVFVDLEENSLRRTGLPGTWPQWLPDSNRVLFQGPSTLMLFDVATGRSRIIIELKPPSILESFTVTGDGKAIFYSSFERTSDLWLLTLDGQGRAP